ncbi:MAG: PKD domain-containing protein [Bacteroidota bacterium]
MKILIEKISLVAVVLALITFASCNDDEPIEVIPDPIAGFSQTVDQSTGEVFFINTSENAVSYSWDFGDGTSSIEVSPKKTYPTGSYTVTLTVTNEVEVSDTFEDTFTITVPEAVTLPITFDGENVDYSASLFGGASFEVVENPDVSGTNDKSGNVGAVTNSGNAFEGFFFDLGEPIDLSENMAIKMNFWSQSAIDVLLKLEEGTAGAIETTASHGGSGWETITFNFSSEEQYSRLTMFVDGPGTTSGTFYVDDIEQTERLAIPVLPTDAAPAPMQAAASVISIYSDAYDDVPRDGFNFYGNAAFEEVQLNGNGVLKYTFAAGDGGNFQVIELGGANQIDAAAAGMTNYRFDIWFPNEVDAASAFLMKIVNFGGSTSEALINVNATSNPAISQGSWLSFDIPFSELTANGLAESSNIQQIVIDLVTSGEAYIDNIYFYNANGGGGGDMPPADPAPTPTFAAADVISVYSDAYDDVPRDGFNFYGNALFEEVQLAGNGALKYTFNADAESGGNFQVIELGGANQIDAAAAGMTNFRFDIWFSREIVAESAFLMKIVNFGSSTSEALINVNGASSPAIAQGSWLSFDIPFSELTANGLAESSNIQQVVIDLINSGEVYVDNILFYNADGSGGGGGSMTPTSPAPTPTEPAADVISVYSDAYTDVAKDGFNFYGNALFEEVQLTGNGALKYTFNADAESGGNFQVIELGGANQIDAAAAGMTNFRFDIWFPNEVVAETAFLMKLVDIGAATSEALINVNASSNPAVSQGSWLQFDIPFSELQANGLAASSNIQQVVIDLVNSGEVFIDNIYFYKSSGSGGGGGGGTTTPIIELTFDDAASVESWNPVASAAGAPETEASRTWNDTEGVGGGGALQLFAKNPVDTEGKAYIFQLDAAELDFDGATSVTLTFDAKLDGPLTASAFHLQTIFPGLGATNEFDLQAKGLNQDGYFSFSFDFDNIDAGATTFSIHFNFAAGAVLDAGGTALIDNVKLVKKN